MLITISFCSKFMFKCVCREICPSVLLLTLKSFVFLNRFDGFTSTFQDKLFKGYDMEIHNQIFYTTLCSCVLSLSGKFSVYSESWDLKIHCGLHMANCCSEYIVTPSDCPSVYFLCLCFFLPEKYHGVFLYLHLSFVVY